MITINVISYLSFVVNIFCYSCNHIEKFSHKCIIIGIILILNLAERIIPDMIKRDTKYITLYNELKSKIIMGVYPYGSKLPSKRNLAMLFGYSVISVEHSLELLYDEGYISSKERSGYFVSFDGGSSQLNETEGLSKTYPIPHSVDSNFPITVLSKAMRSIISEYGERLLVKSPNNGIPELREAIQKYLARNKGIIVSPSQIIIGSGAEYLYSLISQMFREEKTFAIESPSYDMIRRVYEANGVKYEMLKLGNDGIYSSELQNTKATVLHVTPFMSYPTGVCASASKKQEYINWAKSKNGVIVEDDFGSEFTISKKHEDTLMSMWPDGNIVYINTFSKTIAPSLRIGYAVISKSLYDIYTQKTGFYSCSVPVFEQLLIAELLNNGDFERHINRVRRIERENIKKN